MEVIFLFKALNCIKIDFLFSKKAVEVNKNEGISKLIFKLESLNPKGNGNNFESKELCEKECAGYAVQPLVKPGFLLNKNVILSKK